MQNSSLFVASKAVLNPPHKMMPAKMHTTPIVSTEHFALGCRRKLHVRFSIAGFLSKDISAK
jgi:hypothetical protein